MRMTIFHKHPKTIAALAALFLFVSGWAVGLARHISREEACLKQYSFINASVACGKSAVIRKTGYAETQEKIAQFIDSERAAERVSEVALYFRDLSNGPVFGVNELAEFAPASLLKLPLALVYLNEAEREPELLAQSLAFEDEGWHQKQEFPPPEDIETEHPYSVEELLRRMLAYSDNLAAELLENHIAAIRGNDVVKDTYLELGIIAPGDILDEVVNVRRYASIFRVLYNASFLTPESSEKALGWLSESSFKDGLVGGVPKEMRIAHKFGERERTADGAKQLHDCGIIYYPENPYLLCVMTRGKDFNELAAIIAHISKEVYEEVNSRRL